MPRKTINFHVGARVEHELVLNFVTEKVTMKTDKLSSLYVNVKKKTQVPRGITTST
jgi:hypothetical protein